MKLVKRIIITLVLLLLLPILFINIVILVDSFVNPDEVPSFFGWKPFIVLTSSMETEINAGDVVVTKETNASELVNGDIIAYKKNNVVTTHRIVQKEENEDGSLIFTTKGDNNNTEDSQNVYENEIEGKYEFKISHLGNIAIFIQTPIGMISCLSIPVLIIIISQIIQSRQNIALMKKKTLEQKDMQEQIEKLKKENEELTKRK